MTAVNYKHCLPCRAHPRFFWTVLSYIFPLVLHPWKWITRDISNHNNRVTGLSSLKPFSHLQTREEMRPKEQTAGTQPPSLYSTFNPPICRKILQTPAFKDSYLPTVSSLPNPECELGDILAGNRKQIMNKDRRVPRK